jgi:hypothetical protein
VPIAIKVRLTEGGNSVGLCAQCSITHHHYTLQPRMLSFGFVNKSI